MILKTCFKAIMLEKPNKIPFETVFPPIFNLNYKLRYRGPDGGGLNLVSSSFALHRQRFETSGRHTADYQAKINIVDLVDKVMQRSSLSPGMFSQT
jgi:hypothetical protein